MNMRSILVSLLVLVCLSPLSAFASGFVKAAGVYLSEESGQGTLTKGTRTLIDIGGGYVSQQGWTFGALYGMEKRKSGDTSTDRTSMGPSVGWITRKESGAYVIGTYFISSELSPNYKGSGYQFDLGYKFSVGKVALAMQISYKHFEYNKAGSASLEPALVNNHIDPYFALLIEF